MSLPAGGSEGVYLDVELHHGRAGIFFSFLHFSLFL